jgi:hypothetical protein
VAILVDGAAEGLRPAAVHSSFTTGEGAERSGEAGLFAAAANDSRE